MSNDIVARLRLVARQSRVANGNIAAEAADEIERLRELKTPASRELLNITKGLLDATEAENAKLRAALTKCANKLERSAIAGGTDAEFAAAVVAEYRALTEGKD